MRIPQTSPELGSLIPASEFTPEAFARADLHAFVAHAQRRYWSWDKVRRAARQGGLDPKLAWLAIRISRLGSARHTPLLGHDGATLNYWTPDSIQQEQMLIDRQLGGVLGTDDGAPIDDEMKSRFIVSALMEEAIASSMLEGASTTVRVAKEMLRQGRRPRTRGERMIVNNYAAIRFACGRRAQPLSAEMLIEMQAMLTEGTLDRPDESGRLRRPDEEVLVSDREGNTLRTPPPAEELPQRLRTLCEFANAPDQDERGQFMHPFTRACLLHFQIGFDHPFCDGNGRTARLVFYWSMLSRGYWLFEFLPVSRLIYRSPGQYGRAFLDTEADSFDATYFLAYHARVVSRARDELTAYIRAKRAEQARARALFAAAPDLNTRQQALLMHAVENPSTLYTIESHQTSHAVAYATARADLLGLESMGYLTRRTRGKRFEFSPAPQLIETHRSRFVPR
ncbi:MAG TPA: Fic family protein [Phycisphaerales bacterium]|nr:Fic family protein [Phycisphaerales bacterium]